jgi:hypothetical protein
MFLEHCLCVTNTRPSRIEINIQEKIISSTDELKKFVILTI